MFSSDVATRVGHFLLSRTSDEYMYEYRTKHDSFVSETIEDYEECREDLGLGKETKEDLFDFCIFLLYCLEKNCLRDEDENENGFEIPAFFIEDKYSRWISASVHK